MEYHELFAMLLSSTVLSTLITTLLNSFSNRKKNSLENITKERKNWRDEMRILTEEIIKSETINDLKICVGKLKVRINVYGIVHTTPFNDALIWSLINEFEKETESEMKKERIEHYKRLFVNQIACILKLNWDRSKGEIQGNIQTRLVSFSLIISFLFYTANYILKNSLENDAISKYISFCIVYFLFVLFSVFMITMADKWKTKTELKLYIFAGITLFFLLCTLFYKASPDLIPCTFYENVVLAIPVLTLLYSCEIKILIYRRNVGRFILSTAILSGKTEIDDKLKVFLVKRHYQSILANKEIIFETSSVSDVNCEDKDIESAV